jgi:aminoglycoside N3'-acetyltransferase
MKSCIRRQVAKLHAVITTIKKLVNDGCPDFIVLNLTPLYFRAEALLPDFRHRIYDLVESTSKDTCVIVPAFTFFSQSKREFSLLHSRPTLGWFNSFAYDIFKSGCITHSARSRSATHSFFLFGLNAKELAAGTSKLVAFGEGSLFSVLGEHDGLWINIGCEPNQGYSLIHGVECDVGVPYRELISLPVRYEDENSCLEDIDYRYYARAEGYNTEQEYEVLLRKQEFRSQNLCADIHFSHSAHRYSRLTSIIAGMLAKDIYAFISHSEDC